MSTIAEYEHDMESDAGIIVRSARFPFDYLEKLPQIKALHGANDVNLDQIRLKVGE